MRIGIFGGSFNPVHKMHIEIANDAIKYNELDKVIYVPTGNKYAKANLESDQDRLNMLKLAIKNNGNENIEYSDYEMQDERIYTYQTLTYFKEKYNNDEIYFIMGADNFDEFDTWREYEYMLDNFKFLIIKRNNSDLNHILDKYKKFENNIFFSKIIEKKISSTDIRKT